MRKYNIIIVERLKAKQIFEFTYLQTPNDRGHCFSLILSFFMELYRLDVGDLLVIQSKKPGQELATFLFI